MQSLVRTTGRWVWVAMAALVLAACDSGGGRSVRAPVAPDPVGTDDPPAVIEGVATPSSVAVVTATNAN